jgi:hypothetical protein
MVFAAGVQFRRVGFTEDAAKAQEQAEAAEKETQRLLWGDFVASVGGVDAVVPVQGELRRLTAERGRVWRQLDLLQSTPTGYQLELTVRPPADAVDPLADPDGLADPGAPAAATAAASSDSLPVNTVVYGFAEEMDEAGQPIPVYYLGEFKVLQSQAGQVTLEPTRALQSDQLERIAQGFASRWTLYELLPLDSHTAFAAAGSQPSAEELYGRMDEAEIGQLFGQIPAEDGRQQALLDAYLRDGTRASDNDPAEAVWVQVNILKDYELDVDSQVDANATGQGYFDSIGRSIDSRLKRDDEGRVVLTPDMKDKPIIFKEYVVQKLLSNGIVELVQRIFVRPLNDYETAFNELVIREHEVSEQIKLYERDSSEIDSSNQLGQEMISFRQVEHQQLQADLQGYQQEITVLQQAIEAADQDLAQLKSQLSEMYRSIQSAHQRLLGGTVNLTSAPKL